MGDGITECGARLVVGLFDGDLAADRRRGARPAAPTSSSAAQMLDALAMVALDRPPLLPTVDDVLRRFPGAASEATP